MSEFEEQLNDSAVTEEHLKEIEKMFEGKSFFQRLMLMKNGLKKPRDSKEYKEAMLELQRLSAPATAIVLPILAILILALISATTEKNDRVIETTVMEAEVIKDLEKVEPPEPPEEQEIQEMDTDIPMDTPNVQIDTAAPEPNQPVTMQQAPIDAVSLVKSPVILKNIYGSTRNTGSRGAQLSRYGGDAQTEAAVLRALRWLKKKQRADGSWGGNSIAMTSLSILTFLAHGEKPGEKEFGDTVQKALEYLISKQRSDGKFIGMDSHEYALPIAAYALSEAYGMTMNPNVKEAARKALVPIIKGQHPTGGWTYNVDPKPEANGKYRDDTSYMGWCAQALKAAKLSKIDVEGLEKASKLAIKGFKSNGHNDGGFGYCGPSHNNGLSSVGALSMMLLGAYNDSAVRKTMSNVMSKWSPFFVSKSEANPTSLYKSRGWSDYNLGSCPQYYFYYATQCMFHEGGKNWTRWNKVMKPAYIKSQIIEKAAIEDANGKLRDIGHWENSDNHSDRPVMDTCLTALQLMVYYRYLPTTSKSAVAEEVVQEASSSDTDDVKVEIEL